MSNRRDFLRHAVVGFAGLLIAPSLHWRRAFNQIPQITQGKAFVLSTPMVVSGRGVLQDCIITLWGNGSITAEHGGQVLNNYITSGEDWHAEYAVNIREGGTASGNIVKVRLPATSSLAYENTPEMLARGYGLVHYRSPA